MRSLNSYLCCVFLLGFLVASCQSSPPNALDATEVHSSTRVQAATELPVLASPTFQKYEWVPTATPKPTRTPTKIPSMFSSPTPQTTLIPFDPLPQLLDDPKILTTQDLRYFSLSERGALVNFHTAEGFVIHEGETVWKDLKNLYATDIDEGEGIVLQLKYSPVSRIRIFFKSIHNGEELRWGVQPDYYPKTYVRIDETDIGGQSLKGNFILQPDTYYNVLLAVGDPGIFRVVFWMPDNPESRVEVIQQMPDVWSGLKWELDVRVLKGQIVLERLARIEFKDYR